MYPEGLGTVFYSTCRFHIISLLCLRYKHLLQASGGNESITFFLHSKMEKKSFVRVDDVNLWPNVGLFEITKVIVVTAKAFSPKCT